MTNTIRTPLALCFASILAACSGAASPSSAGTIDAAGGSLRTESGITLTVPPGALARETEIRIVESEPAEGKMARVVLEPRGLALAAPATVAFEVEDRNVVVTEIEHGPEGEVRREMEKRNGTGEVEVEVEHLGELEVEHGLICDPGCGDGLECDDGVCKPHGEDDPATHDAGDDDGLDDPATHDAGDDHGVDPAPAPGATPDDNGVDPAPAPAPVPDDNGGTTPGHP
jgi:hypothetical protein